MRKKKVGSYLDILNREVYASIPAHLLNGKWTYKTIQELADTYLDCSVQDLCGLDTENDPFYCGAPGHKSKAEWIEKHWPEIMRGREKISIRTVHYWLATKKVEFPEGYRGQKGKDHYMNDEGCLGLCNLAVKYARYLGLVRYDQIVDEKTSEPKDNTRYYTWREAKTELSWDIEEPDLPEADLPNLSFPDLPSFNVDTFDVPQKYHLEIWCEKSTMNHILEPLAKKYKAVYQDLSGESSATRVRDAVLRIKIDGRPVRICYISDYDPAGENMPRAMSVKLWHGLLERCPDMDVRVYPIALTEEQVNEYDLERIPLKESELRGKGFEERHDKVGGVELDALEATHPGLLRSIVSDWLDGYFDHDLEDDVESAKEDLEEKLTDIEEEALEPMQDRLDDFEQRWEKMCEQVKELITPMFEERDELWAEAYDLLDACTVDYSEDDMPQPEYEDEDPHPLFDNMRKRLVQNLFFQAHKRNTPLEEVQKQVDESGIETDRGLAG
jgi:hypothetical protein